MERKQNLGIWRWLVKAVLAGVIAFIALTLFCIVYYKVPPHYISSDTVTDYAWKPNAFRCTMREGVLVSGHINNEGYSNTFDYSDDLPIETLVMGSSHMEAFQVDSDQSVAYLLNEAATEGAVYNLGLSNYNLLTCADDLHAALERYCPSKFVVIEVAALQVDDAGIRDVLSGSFKGLNSRAKGLEGMLQEDPYLRLLYKQAQGYQREHAAPSGAEPAHKDPGLLSELFSYMSEEAADAGVRLIIAYHPGTTLNRDGTLGFSSTPAEENTFAACCEENGIRFLNMRSRFQTEYEENHILPYGFANSAVGSGHLNRYGHRMMAEELYALMQENGL